MTAVDPRNAVLIEARDLTSLLQSKSHVVLIDTRFDEERKHVRPATWTSHIPGAVYVDVSHQLAGKPTTRSGRRPLPDIAALQRDAREWGIRQNSTVIVYDEVTNSSATRAWWILRWAGIEDVRILNGGIAAWTAAGFAVTPALALPSRGDVTLSAGHLPTLDVDEAAAIARSGQLLDGRARDAYLGGPAESGKPKTGHIPGAISVPAGNLVKDGSLVAAVELRSILEPLGHRPDGQLGAYCGSGTAATILAAGFATLGITLPIYVGSWSAWSADTKRPISTGSDPG